MAEQVLKGSLVTGESPWRKEGNRCQTSKEPRREALAEKDRELEERGWGQGGEGEGGVCAMERGTGCETM